MSTEPAWRPEIVPGGGFDPRAMADDFWAKGNYEAANEMGRLVASNPSRICHFTGLPADGYARIPGTDGAADVAISHGQHGYPTPLQRWNGGWIDDQGTRRDAERPQLRVAKRNGTLVLPLASIDSKAKQGGEVLVGVLGLDVEALLDVDYAADGTILLRLHVAPKPGPTPVAD